MDYIYLYRLKKIELKLYKVYSSYQLRTHVSLYFSITVNSTFTGKMSYSITQSSSKRKQN